MAVGLVVVYPGVTPEEWERVIADTNLPDGCLAQGFGDNGGHVLTFELWSSRSDFDRFHAEAFRWSFRLVLHRGPPNPKVTQVDLASLRTR
jgi:hypothetical protein